MSQVDEYTIPGSPLNMAQLQTRLQNIFAAIGSGNRGSTAPLNQFDGMIWIDDSATPVEVLKVYNSTTGWIEYAQVNTDTGIYSLSYDNTISGLTAETVKAAIDELSSEKIDIVYAINKTGNHQRIDAGGTTDSQAFHLGGPSISNFSALMIESDVSKAAIYKTGTASANNGRMMIANDSNHNILFRTGSPYANKVEILHAGGMTIVDDAPATPAANTLYADSMVKASASVVFVSGDPTLRESFNISGSPIDNIVGNTTLTLATNMNTSNYQAFGSVTGTDMTFSIGRSPSSMTMATNDLAGTPTDAPFTIGAIGEQ